jgi:hypothetical protein
MIHACAAGMGTGVQCTPLSVTRFSVWPGRRLDDPCHQLTQMATHLVKRRIGSGPAAPRQQSPATALAQAPEFCGGRGLSRESALRIIASQFMEWN